MFNLQDSIKTIRNEANTKINTARAVAPVAKQLSKLCSSNKSYDSVSLYHDDAYIYVGYMDLDTFEDVDMPAIQAAFGPLKWSREVTDCNVKYSFKLERHDRTLNCYFVCNPVEGICEIVKRPTGRKVMQSKWVQEEVDEFETVVNCDPPRE